MQAANNNSQEQIESDLRYQLQLYDLELMTQKHSINDCFATILGIDGAKLHQIICSKLAKWIQQKNLPRKLQYIAKNNQIYQDYKKYPDLYNFSKITAQVISQIYETRISIYYLNLNRMLTAIIINEKGYQQEIKIARVNNRYIQIKDNFYSQSSGKQEVSSSNQSYKLYQAFDIQPIQKKVIQPKVIDLTKSYSQTPGSPLIKKNFSLCEDRNIIFNAEQANVHSPTIVSNTNIPLKQMDQISLQNAVDQSEIFNSQQLGENPISFSRQDLTQSLTIQKGQVQPQQATPIQNGNQNKNTIQSALNQQQMMHSVQEPIPSDGNQFYGYYSHQMYFSPFMVGQGSTRNENYSNGFNNLSNSVSMSPGKNIVRRQNSTLQINQNQRYTGRLKFFDQGKNYGFIIMDADQSDIFVHCDDLQKAGISKERVRSYKQSEGMIRFSFKVMSYFGKYKESRKAVDLTILDDGLGMPSLYP